MSILKVIEDYHATTDTDLQYMALKNDFVITDIDNDLRLLMSKLVIPLLLNEESMTLVNLVSYEFLPSVITKVRNDHEGDTVIFKMIEELILLQLVENFDAENRTLVFFQALRDSLKVIYSLMTLDEGLQNLNGNKEIKPKVVFNPDNSFVKYFLTQVNENEISELDPHLYRECLNFLILIYYDGHTYCIENDILKEIFKHYSSEEEFDPTLKELLSNVCHLTSGVELSKASEFIDHRILFEISKYWYKFNLIINEYFDSRLLPKLEIRKIENLDEIIETVQIILNFQPFYNERLLDTDLPYLSQSNIIRLIEDLLKLCNFVQIQINERKLDNNLLSETSVRTGEERYVDSEGSLGDLGHDHITKRISEDKEEPSEQDAYVEELSKSNTTYGGYDEDEEEIVFEDDSNNEDEGSFLAEKEEKHENDDEIETLQKIETVIIEVLRKCDISSEIENHFLHVSDSFIFSSFRELNVKVNDNEIIKYFEFPESALNIDLKLILEDPDYSHKLTKSDILFSLDQLLAESIDDLINLQFCVDVVDKLLRDKKIELNENDQATLSLMLVPHTKRNKLFVRIIKVGNMKQKVDEGLSVRTSIYSTLLQMEKVQFNVSCKILEEVVNNGLKSKNDTITYLSEQIIIKILDYYYDTIEGLSQDWYQANIMTIMLDFLYGSSYLSRAESYTLLNIVNEYPSVIGTEQN